MNIDDYQYFRDFYSLEGLNTARGEEMVEDEEPLVQYELDVGDIRVYDVRTFLGRFIPWKPDYVFGMDIEIGEESREMYLEGTLDDWSEFDSEIMQELERSEQKRVLP